MAMKKRVFQCYRIVQTKPPSEYDFYSAQARGHPLVSQRFASLWGGVSVWETVTQARNRAKAGRPPGAYIAELRIPQPGPVRIERTTTKRGHYSLWAQPKTLLKMVSRVIPV